MCFMEVTEQWTLELLVPSRECCTMVIPQLRFCGKWQLAEVTMLDPGWVLQVWHAGDSRTVHVSLVTGEPARDVERRGICPL